MSGKSFSLNVGDVFSVPIDADRIGIGQVVATYGAAAHYFAIFDASLPSKDPSVDVVHRVITRPLLLLALSFNARLVHGFWVVLANRPVVPVELPAYKEGRLKGDGVVDWIVDHSGTLSRPASDSEVEQLIYRKIVSPMVVEMATQAKLGVLPWASSYDALLPSATATTRQMFGPAVAS